MGKLFALIAIFSLLLACQSQPEVSEDSPEASEAVEQEQAGDDENSDEDDSADDHEEMIGEDEEKINDLDGLEEGEGEKEAGAGDEEEGVARRDCPPPKETDPDTVCAQVIVFGLTKEGRCCQYPNPCVVPDEIVEEFRSLDECRTAAGQME